MIIYKGLSLLDGKPIVAIATGYQRKSRNIKTGDMIQVWIIRSDIAPHHAIHTGDDVSICGNCKHRGIIVDNRNKERTCYVLTHNAPRSVFATFMKGLYPVIAKIDLTELGKGRKIRIGAYGDPAAVPISIWDSFLSEAEAITGYTHQWQDFPELAKYVMASADSASEAFMAQIMGFRTFRVKSPSEPKIPKEVVCPAQDHKTDCASCKACGGLSAKAKANIVIDVHGAGAKHFEKESDYA